MNEDAGRPATVPALRRPPRETVVTVGALVLLATVAWTYTTATAGSDMSDGVLTRHASDPMSSMGPMTAESDAWGWSTVTFLGTWTVMMVAMMFPATSPVVLIFDRWRRSRGRTAASTTAFVSGYLAVWSAAGVLAYGLNVGLDSVLDNTSVARTIGGAVLIGAGMYQLSPMKSACLTQCRSPLSLIMQHGQRLGRGLAGPLRVGFGHGAYCLGCCWALMAVLVVLGVMNLGWMAGVSAVILAEKVLPHPRVTTYAVAAVLMLSGLAVLVPSS